ncbi:MAG TPA: universal stress protein [Acidobacteriaceae bacterium]|nr:universal stress protein [Acidobacteriaceae bacterium]
MKILLPIDGSINSDVVIQEVIHRPWPTETQLRIISVAQPIPQVLDPLLVGRALYIDSLAEERKRARQVVDEAARKISHGTPFLEVSTQVLDGSPKTAILEEAKDWGADLIMLGSHGYGAAVRFLLGSVAHAVALHAPYSVEIVRGRPARSNPQKEPAAAD